MINRPREEEVLKLIRRTVFIGMLIVGSILLWLSWEFHLLINGL